MLINVGSMHISFDGLIGSKILIYLYDLTIFSKEKFDHFAHPRAIFINFRKYSISLYPSKSIFRVGTRKFLGHVVSSSEINIDPNRVNKIQNLSPPRSKKDIQAFTGKNIFLRRFVTNFFKIAKPRHNMLKSDQTFKWDSTAQYS